MRRLALCLFLSACGTSGHQPAPPSNPQPVAQPAGPNAMTVLRDRWLACVHGSFAQQRHMSPDKSAAVEAAFLSCQTEEQAMVGLAHAVIQTPSIRAQVLLTITALKTNTKQGLVSTQ